MRWAEDDTRGAPSKVRAVLFFAALFDFAVVAHMAILYHHHRRRESRLVLGRLARAVAALATQWREWKDVVKMTVQTFGASPDKYASCRGCTLLLHRASLTVMLLVQLQNYDSAAV